MLNWLLGVKDKVYDFFGTLYTFVKTIVTYAYYNLMDYSNFLHTTLQDYKYYKSHHLSHYADSARWPTDDIAVYNYAKTRFSAVDSFYDLMEYRYALQSALRDYRNRYQWPVAHTLGTRLAQTLTVVDSNPYDLHYINRVGVHEVQRYHYVFKPGLELLHGQRMQLLTMSGLPSYPRFLDYVHNRSHKVQEYTDLYHSKVQSLSGRFSGLMGVTEPARYTRITDFTDRRFAVANRVFNVGNQLAQLGSYTYYDRLMFLVDQKWTTVFPLINNPTETILAFLEDDILDWLWERIVAKLNEPAQHEGD